MRGIEVKGNKLYTCRGVSVGELKHGPIALVDKSMPVVALNPSTKVFEKTLSNLEEVKARKGKIILLTDKKGKELSKV